MMPIGYGSGAPPLLVGRRSPGHGTSTPAKARTCPACYADRAEVCDRERSGGRLDLCRLPPGTTSSCPTLVPTGPRSVSWPGT